MNYKHRLELSENTFAWFIYPRAHAFRQRMRIFRIGAREEQREKGFSAKRKLTAQQIHSHSHTHARIWLAVGLIWVHKISWYAVNGGLTAHADQMCKFARILIVHESRAAAVCIQSERQRRRIMNILSVTLVPLLFPVLYFTRSLGGCEAWNAPPGKFEYNAWMIKGVSAFLVVKTLCIPCKRLERCRFMFCHNIKGMKASNCPAGPQRKLY